MLGVVPTDEATRMARDVGMDLVEVSPNERPPVCKIMDYGRHKYLQSKKLKQKHHERRTKEIRLRPKTDPHDAEIKINRARTFLEHGDRVQFTMMFRGRERFHADSGYETFRDILAGLGELAKAEQPARLMGRRLTMVLAPGKPPKVTKSSSGEKPKSRDAARPGVEPTNDLPDDIELDEDLDDTDDIDDTDDVDDTDDTDDVDNTDAADDVDDTEPLGTLSDPPRAN
jgi:translation initiation factor IF-3